MVALDLVHASNAQLRELGPGLVALFVGATSGIGEFTAKAFVRNTIGPHVYIVGRNASAAERIIGECKELNKDGKVEFLKADVTELGEVDRVCEEIKKRETYINLLVQSQGNLNLRGRDENSEGLDRKMTLNYYSRMRFINNLLPLLRTATTQPPHFSRTLSILGAGHERPIDFTDLELKNTFTGARCAYHTTVMNDFLNQEFANREPGISFVHTSPGIVDTGVARELPVWLRVPLKVFTPLLKPFMVGREETGARQLFIATSGLYPPAKPVDAKGAGIKVPEGLDVCKGADGTVGSGAYNLNWDGERTGKEPLLTQYREKGAGKTFWEHTMGIFERVEKINAAKTEVK